MITLFWWIVAIVLFLILISIRQINQYERGVKFTLGKFTSVKMPGWRLIVPVFQSMTKVDIRTKAVDVENQDAITADNVSAKINAVIYYKVKDAAKAIIEVENFRYAVTQLAQTTMRNIVGEVTLDELLTGREKISAKIEEIVEKASDHWGIEVESVQLKDINLPETMIRTMAKQAEAEREKRAVIINAEGEKLAAKNISEAADMLSKSPGAIHLRTLHSINDISSDASNTVVFAVPLEILRAIEGLAEKFKK